MVLPAITIIYVAIFLQNKSTTSGPHCLHVSLPNIKDHADHLAVEEGLEVSVTPRLAEVSETENNCPGSVLLFWMTSKSALYRGTSSSNSLLTPRRQSAVTRGNAVRARHCFISPGSRRRWQEGKMQALTRPSWTPTLAPGLTSRMILNNN